VVVLAAAAAAIVVVLVPQTGLTSWLVKQSIVHTHQASCMNMPAISNMFESSSTHFANLLSQLAVH